MTKKLFYEDAYQKEFSATVLEIKEAGGFWKILLDQTAFYPEGGGQNADHGTLVFPDGNCLNVVDVQEHAGEIWHTAEAHSAELKACQGAAVQGQIDWARRFDHMQQHSGEHIVSGMICSRFHCDNIGFHMGEDVVLIDYNACIRYEEALEVEQAANAYLWEDHPLEVMWPSKEELQKLEYRSKKELEGEVRITSFPGADTCACCGTHVSSGAQVGLVKFLSARPVHDGTRLELLCGKRAMDYLTMNHRENKEVGVLLSAKEDQTAERVRKLLDENVRLKTAAAELADKVFPVWAEQFRNKGRSFVIDDQLTPQQGRMLADLIADCCGGIAAVFTKTETGYAYTVICKNEEAPQQSSVASCASINVSDLVRDLNKTLNGRGGGRNGFAQGSVTAGRSEIRDYFSDYAQAD